MAACSICDTSTLEPVGALCVTCAAAIAGPAPRAPGIITSKRGADDAAAWLIDAWGQLHPVGPACRVGRDRDANELLIADLVISAEHAELRCERGRWLVRDRGSANGSGIQQGPRVREAQLLHRGRVWFGSVEFYFWAETAPPVKDVPPPQVRTYVPERAAFRLVAPERGELKVRAAPGHPIARAPGELEYFSPDNGPKRRAALARLQFQLLRALCEAALSVADDSAPLVGTHELLTSLPFNTPHPEPNHVRQVVASLRATLERAGVPGGGAASAQGVIHATEGLGYRVTWQVSRVSPR